MPQLVFATIGIFIGMVQILGKLHAILVIYWRSILGRIHMSNAQKVTISQVRLTVTCDWAKWLIFSSP
jgi:hypothetical protein